MSTIMMTEALWGLLPAGLIVGGGLMLWAASWRRQRRSTADPFARSPVLLNLLGWTTLLVGMLAAAVCTAWFFSPVIIVIGIVVIASAFVRHRHSEVRYLIWLLAEAAERGVPLEKAARGFASEREGFTASAARSLADYLDAAMPLSLALSRSGLWVSAEVRLAAEVGEKTGTLGPSLLKAIEQSNLFDRALGSVLAKFFYLSCIVLVMIVVVTFMMIQIVPTFEQMFAEFGLALPAATRLLISISRFVVNFWFLLIPLLLLLVVGILAGLLVYVGVSVKSVPVIRLFVTPVDSTTILHSLATAVEQRQPIAENLLLLASLARTPGSRRKLGLAAREITEGAHWCDALEHAGFISRAQNAVIASAERAGNLAWALNEMADGMIRRAAHRAQAALNILFPTCLVSFGFCVLMVCVGMMMPLFKLISDLT